MIPITELLNLQKEYIDDIADRLWHEYYCPVTPHKPEVKRFIMNQYNTVATMINKAAEFKRVVLITPSMVWKNTQCGMPERKKKLYVDIVQHTEKKQTVVLTRTGQGGAVEKYISKSKSPSTTPAPVSKPAPVHPMGGKSINEIVIPLHEAGKTNQEIMEITGLIAKQVRDCIFRVKGALGIKNKKVI